MSEKYQYDLCVVGGAGRVGLPLSVSFALKSVNTVILDINQEALDQISAGKFPFKENKGPESLTQALAAGTLTATNKADVIANSQFVLLVVGTPLDDYLDPDFSAITSVIEQYLPHFQDDQILILRSTVYPGTTKKIQKYFERKGKKIKVVFCPERIAEGKAIEELSSLPQIISSFDKHALEQTKKLFSKLTDKIIEIKPQEAELVKLFTNAWRYISFAAANQFFMLAENFGSDYNNIYHAMTQDYPRAKDLPAPGFAAGPCLLKDTMQLASYSNNNFSLGHSAMLINEGLPKFVVDMAKKRLRESSSVKKLGEVNIGILGMAFKAGSDNKLDSLSYKLKKICQFEFGQVLCHDVYINDEDITQLDKVLKDSDVIIVGTPHSAYRNINPADYPKKIFVDIWNILNSGQ